VGRGADSEGAGCRFCLDQGLAPSECPGVLAKFNFGKSCNIDA
jgi:hypothetical protein